MYVRSFKTNVIYSGFSRCSTARESSTGLSLVDPAKVVVSIGHLTAFYVIFVPLEYVPSEPPHYTYSQIFGIS